MRIFETFPLLRGFKDEIHSWTLVSVMRMKVCLADEGHDVHQSPIRNSTPQWRQERRVMMTNGSVCWMTST